MDFPVSENFTKTANAEQLHAEARGLKKDWPASFVQIDGSWVYRVDRDNIDPQAVQAALDAHTPDPDYGKPQEQKDAEASTAEVRKVVAKAKAIIASGGTDATKHLSLQETQLALAHLIVRAAR